jgi:glycosyltransferase involved in cell wall biosynthesis
MSTTARSRPLVSILIPSYNSQRWLADCVNSALDQTYPCKEIILVDDGSTDSSLALARTFESKGVIVLTQPNGGQPAALNTAFARSRGDFIQYLDADDMLAPEKIELQMDRLLAADSRAIAAGAWGHFTTEPSTAEFRHDRVWRDLAPVDWLVESWTGGGMMPPIGWLLPRPIVEAAAPWDVSLRWAPNVDGDFFTRTMLAASSCIFVPEAKSYYRAVPGSHSKLRTPRSLEGALRLLLKTGEAVLTVEDSARTRSAYADNLQRFVHRVYPDHPELVAPAERRIAELGGSKLKFQAGRVTGTLARFVGWKAAKRMRRAAATGLGR